MLLNFDTPKVMTIINVTPDSFFGGSRAITHNEMSRKISQAVEEGCDIIDIGGYSSKPNATDITIDEEIRRVSLGVAVAREIAPHIPISIDSFRAPVIQYITNKYGEVIVNDISAGELDSQMIKTVAELKLPYIAMHMRGTPQDMQMQTTYDNIANRVITHLKAKAEELEAAGVTQIILDPGFGFAKTLEQNYTLLGALPQLVALGYPVLAGVSRKSMIYKALDTTPEDSLGGTIALNWECLRSGCTILRVHDTKQAIQTIKLFKTYEANR